MSRIRSRDTTPERSVRSALHQLGLRFTINGPRNTSLPGKPDIVLPRHRTVVFVHGCFWHRHHGCKLAATPKSRTGFWHHKFTTNVARDQRNQAALDALGWRVVVVWECETRNRGDLLERLRAAFHLQPGRRPRPGGASRDHSAASVALVAEEPADYRPRRRRRQPPRR